MTMGLYTNSLSAHQLPLAREIVGRIGEHDFRYVYTGDMLQHGSQEVACDEPWVVKAPDPWIESCDVLLSGIRDMGLYERRCRAGLKTYYMSERWFKPPFVIFRLLHPRYFMVAKRISALLRESDFCYLPIGVHAARDMARLYGFLHGDVRCLFRGPSLSFERKPMGVISNYPWMKMWGYFVSPSSFHTSLNTQHSTLSTPLRVLWVGRMLKLKRVDTIIRAVAEVAKRGRSMTLTLVGDGPEKEHLQRLAKALSKDASSCCNFLPSVSMGDVRVLMHNHDVLVFSSNGYDGWGAVVSEALEEGLCVFGSYEAGAPATMLPRSQLFHCGDWQTLSKLLLSANGNETNIGPWTAKRAAALLLGEED